MHDEDKQSELLFLRILQVATHARTKTHFHPRVVLVDKALIRPHPDLYSSLVVVNLCLVPAFREGVGLRAGDVTYLGARQVHQATTAQPNLGANKVYKTKQKSVPPHAALDKQEGAKVNRCTTQTTRTGPTIQTHHELHHRQQQHRPNTRSR